MNTNNNEGPIERMKQLEFSSMFLEILQSTFLVVTVASDPIIGSSPLEINPKQQL